jgi:hypothetical protein
MEQPLEPMKIITALKPEKEAFMTVAASWHTTWRNENKCHCQCLAKKWRIFNYATAYYYKTQI